MKNGLVLWFTGLSGAGKTTVAEKVIEILKKDNLRAILIDADTAKYKVKTPGIWTEEDRILNRNLIIKKVKKFYEKGYIVITAFISPFKKDREFAKTQIPKNFYEIFFDTPIEICKKRDPKGLYKKAQLGIIPNFVGVNIKYEIPDFPALRINTENLGIENSVNKILSFIKEKYENKNFKSS